MARPQRARIELRFMTVATSLIPGLDEIVRRGDPKRRGEIAGAIAALFFQDAAKLGCRRGIRQRTDNQAMALQLLLDQCKIDANVRRSKLTFRQT